MNEYYRDWRNFLHLIIISLLLFVLVGCEYRAEDLIYHNLLALEQAQSLPQSPPLLNGGGVNGSLGHIGEDVYLELERLSYPQDLWPLGFITKKQVFFLSENVLEPQQLWLYDLELQQGKVIIDYNFSNAYLSKEIAFNKEWLIWIEVVKPEHDRQLKSYLWARNIQKEGDDILIDQGVSSFSEGFFLPFDNLDIDANTVAYRYSSFTDGHRETEVRIYDLLTQSPETLFKAAGAGGYQITRCSIADQLVAWDVLTAEQILVPGLPLLTRDRYNLYCYQLDKSKLLPLQDAEQQLAYNRGYGQPFVHQGQIICMERLPATFDDLSYQSFIVSIDPTLKMVSSLVSMHEYSSDLILLYQEAKIPRSIFRSLPFVGKNLLTWHSNIAEQNIVFDMRQARFIWLPLLFEQEAEIIGDDFWVRHLPSLEADYLVFGLTDTSEDHYILRIE